VPNETMFWRHVSSSEDALPILVRLRRSVNNVVWVAQNGQVGKLDLTGGNRILQGEVEVAMSLSQFEGRCENQTLELIFVGRSDAQMIRDIGSDGITA